MLSNLLFFIASGLCAGAIYALIALGYTMVYGVLRLINFAHGEFYMVGAYAGYAAYTWFLAGVPPALAIPLLLLISGFCSALLAVWVERFAYRPLRGAVRRMPTAFYASVSVLAILAACVAAWHTGSRSLYGLALFGLAGAAVYWATEALALLPGRSGGRLSALLTAIGVSFLLQYLATFIQHGSPLHYASEHPGSIGALGQQSVMVGAGGIKVVNLIYIGVAGILTAGLWYVVRRTRFGRAMRAVSHDFEAARMLGIDVDAVVRTTFLLGGLLAGVAGTLVGIQGVIEPQMGFLVGLNAFIAAVVGGIGSIPGAVIGSFLIGLIQSLVVFAGVPTGLKDVASFVVLILVLVVRPQGILGRPVREKV